MSIDDSDRLDLLKLEMQLLQQRLTKYDELIWAVRGWAVTLTVALTGWASTKLDDPDAMIWILRTALHVPALFWIQEGLLRAGYVSRYIDRYRLLRSTLNDSPSDLTKIPLYDLSGHRAGRTPRLLRLFRSFFRLESIFLYLVLTAMPALLMFLPQRDAARHRTEEVSRLIVEETFGHLGSACPAYACIGNLRLPRVPLDFVTRCHHQPWMRA